MNVESICWLYRLNFGGVETRAKAISSYFSKKYKVEMLYAKTLFTRKEYDNPFTEKGLFILRNPYHKIKIRGKRWWHEHFLKKATKYVRNHRHDIDLVYGQIIDSIPGINAGLITIATFHGVDRWIENPPELEKKVIEQAEVLVAITDHVRMKLIKSGADKHKVYTIYNGVYFDSINNIETDFSNLCKKYRLNPNMNIILSIQTRFDPKKNFKRILHSYTELKKTQKDCQMVFIGEGPLKIEAEILVKINGVKDVHFLGYIPTNDVYRLYQASQIFIMPSINESWGIVFMEAMAAGCPVITSALCGITEVVEHKKHAWIVNDPYDQAEITESLLNLYQSDALQKKLRYFGKELAKGFDWTVSGEKYNDIISKISSRLI